jgi:hypothetical protein
MSKKTSLAAILPLSGSSNLLDRAAFHFSPSLSENQTFVDQLVSTSVNESTKGSMLLAMLGAGAVSRLTRAGVMSIALGEGTVLPMMARGGSYAIALANESAAFAGIERGFHPSQTSFEKDWAHAFINLGSLKLLGGAAQGQNLILQHLLTDLGMVGGQQVGAQFGLVEKPQGGLAQQMVQAEAMNWSMKGGMGLLNGLSPNLLPMEKSLDLYLRSRETNLFSKGQPTLPFFSQLVPEGPGVFSISSLEPEGPKGPDRFAMTGGEMEDQNGDLIRTDFSDGSGHAGTDAFYAGLRRVNQKSIPDRIDSIPEGSRKITHSGKTLYISPKALGEMEKLDRFVAELDSLAEIFGFGLTHPLNQETTVVTDFVRPREGKVAVIGKEVFIIQQQGQLFKALNHSESLRLALKENRLFLLSNNEPYSFQIDEDHWSWLRADLQQLTDQELPSDWNQLKTRLEVEGGIPLETDWDLVVSGLHVDIQEAYLNRVIEEAQRQKAQVHFTMHHHPHLGPVGRLLRDSEAIKRHSYYGALLAPSLGDIATHLAMGVDWFEIRALGTEDDVHSRTKTTFVVYGTSELKQAMHELQQIVDSIIRLPPFQTAPENLTPFVEKLQLVGAHQKYADTLLEWIYRDSIREFKKEKAEDIKDARGLILHTLFSSRDPFGELQRLTPSLLTQHVESREKKSSDLPAHEPFDINLRGYSILDGHQTMLPVHPHLSIHSPTDGLFGFEGFGFLIFQRARGRLRNRGLLYCSRLTIFDPATRIAVDSHLPVYYDDFDVFKSDLQFLLHRLRVRGMRLENSRATLIYGRVAKAEENFRGPYPGEMIAEMAKGLGLRVNLSIPADRDYDFYLETGEIIPVPEEE